VRDATLKALIYDRLHRGNPGDVGFYAHECAGAQSVLELGCGSGRVLEWLADEDIPRLVGLDLDPHHVALASERLGAAATVHLGDMRDFEVPGASFDRILIPYNGLYTLPSDEDMVACLACARRHLAPGGAVVLDAYAVTDADIREMALEAQEASEVTFLVSLNLPDDVGRVVVWDREQALPGPRRRGIHYKYDVTLQDGEKRHLEVDLPHHYLRHRDLVAVLDRAGLRLDRLYGDFQGAPYDAQSDFYVVVARR